MTNLPDGHAWAIRNWDEAFTRRDSKQCKTLHWVPWPVKLQGKGYRILASTREGLIALGVFAGLVEAAANLPTRGVLADESGPLDAMDMGVRTGIPYPIIADAIPLLAGPKISWLVPTAMTDGGPSAKPGNTVSHSQNTVSGFAQSRAEQKREEKTEVRLPMAQDAREPFAAAGAGGDGARVIDLSDLPACLPGIEVGGVLAQLGVGDPTRTKLIAAGCTVEAVRAAVAAAEQGDPRNWRKVMIADLQRQFGLRRATVGGRLAYSPAAVSPEAIGAADRIEQMRRSRGLS